MTAAWRRIGVVTALALIGAVGRPAAAEQAIMPLQDVKIGMQGVGRTVFKGTRIEPFDCEVIGILEGFDFEMDMILIRISSGPVVTEGYGVVGGMSGSPIYIDGKMIGALAYGWQFQNEPIAGVTPIEQMMTQYDPQLPDARAARVRRQTDEDRRDDQLQRATDQLKRVQGAMRPTNGPISIDGRTFSELQVAQNPGDAARLHRTRPDVGILAPVATPVYCKGLGGTGMRMMERLLEPYNLVPMQAGAAGAPDGVEASFEPGAAIAVPITTGDIEMTAIGTLTYLDNGIALGFGHPFFGFGDVEMPMATGYIHGVISSLATSNKLGGMLKPVGAITQDRPTCIGGQMGRKADTLPVHYTLTEAGRGTERDFKIQLIRQPSMTDLYTVILMQMAMQNVAGGYFDGVTRSSVTINTRVPEDGANLTIKRSNAFDSKAVSDYGGNPLWDLFQTLSLLRSNPFGEADVESVKVEMQFEAARRLANIERAQAEQQTVKRGEQFAVELFMKPYGGETTSIKIPVQIPDNAPLGPMVVLLVGGNDAAAIRPRINPPPYPNDVPSLVHWLNDTVPNDSVVVEKVLPTLGLEMSGHQLHDFPTPIVEPLFTSTVDDMRMIPDVDENVVPMDDVVAGVAAVMVEVIGDEGQRAEGSGDLGNIPIGPMMMPESPMMNQMMSAAARTMAGLVGELRPTPELSWTLQPPRLSDSSPAMQRLERITAALGGSRSLNFRPHRRGAKVLWPTSSDGRKPQPRQAVARQAEAEPDAADDESGPPDVTGNLKLDERPKMPSWKELEELGSGKMTSDEGAGGEEGEAADEDDGEDKPLARPVATWSLTTVEDFVAGRSSAPAACSDGSVSLAPLTEVLGKPGAERTWSVLALKDGTVVAGSWAPEAAIYQLGADQQVTEYYKTEDAGLMALAQLSDGALVAGGIPSAKIYKITGPGKGSVLADLDEEYIWSLEPDDQGGVYAATGRNGRLYHVDAKGPAKLVMQSSDRPIIDLAPAPGGGVYAATYPLGKVYKVTGDKVESIFQSSNGAVLALAATDNGNVYVGTADSGSIYKVTPDGEVTQVAEVEESHIYAMASVGNTVYAAASGPGQLLRLDDTDTKALVYRTDEPYLLDLAAVDGTALLTTVAGSGEVVKLNLGDGKRGEYLSPVHDAGMRAHWGVARWGVATTGQGRVAVQTRTGNTASPDKAWSDWSHWLTDPHGQMIDSPAARYIQFRAWLYAEPGERCRLDDVTLFYRTLNRPPKVVLETPSAGTVANKTLEISWEAEDPDEDELHYEAFYAPVGSDDWTLIEAASDDEEDAAAEDTGDDATTDDSEPTDDAPSEDASQAEATAATFNPFGPRARPVATMTRFVDALPLQGERPPRGPKTEEAVKEGTPKSSSAEKSKAKEASSDESDDSESAEKLTESSINWDTTKVPDGLYLIKVVVHDEIRNPDDPKVVTVISKPMRVDNTGPELLKPATTEGQPAAELLFRETGTYLSSAEYRIDDGEWVALLPVDGLFDSPEETIRTPALPTEAGEHTLSIRIRDSVGNLAKFQWTFTVGG